MIDQPIVASDLRCDQCPDRKFVNEKALKMHLKDRHGQYRNAEDDKGIFKGHFLVPCTSGDCSNWPDERGALSSEC